LDSNGDGVPKDPRQDEEGERSQGNAPANYPALVEVVIGAALRSLSSQVATLYDQLKSANETEQQERRERQATELYWNKTRAKTAIGFSIASLFLSALTLSVLYKTLGLYGGQATIVSKQATIMSKQHEITEKTLSAIQTQAIAARVSAEAAKSQADSSKVQADAAALSARTTRDMLRVTEAADVNLSAVECSPSSAFGLNTMMTLHYRNSGRTRADNLQSVFSFGIPGALSSAERTTPTGDVSVATVAAGASIPSSTTSTVGELLAKSMGGVPPDQALAKIVAGQIQFGFWGYVQYTDVLKETHRKNFEYVWDRNFPNACLFTMVSTSGQ
jgi:hypothetical protein